MRNKPESQSNHKVKIEEILAREMPMNKARLKCMSMLLLGLIQKRTVNFVSLSLAFQGLAQPESNYRRIKRFFSEVRFDSCSIGRLILGFLPSEPYRVCIDRTNWKFGSSNINILVIAIAHRGIAFPIVWQFLDKRGNSSCDERIDLLQQFLSLVEAKDIAYVLGDREFIGKTWLNYLDKRNIRFSIRIRNNSICDNWCSVYACFAHLPVGELRCLHNTYIVQGCTVRIIGMKLSNTEYAIICTNHQPYDAFLAYKCRWEIEMLFSALKLTGFNFEATHLTNLDKLDTLFALLALAFAWAHSVGEWLHDSKTKVLKLKTHLRREKSFFRHGLDYLDHLLSNLNYKLQQLLFCIQFLSRT